jgi:hypothetical protein
MNAQMILNEIYGTPVADPAVLALAQQLESFTKEFQAGNISNDEYVELLADFKVQQLILAQCNDLAAKERLNNIVNIVLNSASILSSV